MHKSIHALRKTSLSVIVTHLSFLLIAGSALADVPTVTLTTPDKAWVTSPAEEEPFGQQTDQAGANKSEHTIKIDPQKKFQMMNGFGGCFNELGWTALQTLPPDVVRGVLKDLFDLSGANFNFNRTPIGADDYALSWYSLDETPNDFKLEHFSLDRDNAFLIPYIRAAMVYQPEMRLWASDWSPPTWLKTNDAYNGGSLKMDEQSLTTYAAYLSRYVQEYRKIGLNVVSVHVQNEPFSLQTFPSCGLDGNQVAKFVGSYLGPRFAADKPGADIWLGTINGSDFSFVTSVMNDPLASPFIAGAGFQWDGRKIIGQTHQKYPQLPLMQTESECGGGADNWGDAAHTWSLIRDYINDGAGSYIYWNMVLDETGLSTWGWHQNALITVLRAEHKVRYNPEFYVMEHLSHFVQLKAVRIGSVGDWPDVLSFQNPDGSVVTLVANFTGNQSKLHLNYGSKTYQLVLPNSSIASVKIPL